MPRNEESPKRDRDSNTVEKTARIPLLLMLLDFLITQRFPVRISACSHPTETPMLVFVRYPHAPYLTSVKWYFCLDHGVGLSPCPRPSSSLACSSSRSIRDTSLTTFCMASFVHVDSLSTRKPTFSVST